MAAECPAARRPGGPGVVRAVAGIPRASLGTRARRPDARQHPRCTKLLTTDLLLAYHRLTAGLLLAYSWPTPGLLRAHYGLTPDRQHALHEAGRQARVIAPRLGSSSRAARVGSADASAYTAASAHVSASTSASAAVSAVSASAPASASAAASAAAAACTAACAFAFTFAALVPLGDAHHPADERGVDLARLTR